MSCFLFSVQVVCAALCTTLAIINIRQGSFGLATGCAVTAAFSIFLAKITFPNL